MDEAEFKEKYYMYEFLKERITALMKEKKEIDETVMKLTVTYEAIERMEGSGKKIFAPVGSSAFVPATIDTDEIMVSIGANIAILTSRKEAMRIMGERLQAMKKASKEYNEEFIRTRKELDKLAVELQNYVDASNIQ